MGRKAVFLDRDGTINEDVGYVYSPERLHIFRWSAPAIRMLKEAGFIVVIVTNQAGVARGLLTEGMLQEVHVELVRRLRADGAVIDAIYYSIDSPFKPSEMRKPSPGMVKKAVKEFGIDLSSSYVVGDKVEDLLLAKNAGCRGILVKTGYGKGMLDNFPEKVEDASPVYVADDLGDAALWIVSKTTKSELLESFLSSISGFEGMLFSTADAYMDWEELEFFSSVGTKTVLEIGGAMSVSDIQRACSVGVNAISMIYIDGVKNIQTFFDVLKDYPRMKRFVSLRDCPDASALRLIKEADGVIAGKEMKLSCLEGIPILRNIDGFLVAQGSETAGIGEAKSLYGRLRKMYFSV